MRRRPLAVTLAVLLLTLALTTTSVAHAASTTDNPWPYPIICTEAGFTGYGTYHWNGETYIYLMGYIRPCPGVSDPGAGRSFTKYGTDGPSLSPNIGPLFNPEDQDYTFYVSGRLFGSLNAVCVIDDVYVKTTSDGTRMAIPHLRACVSIDQSATAVVITPIPITDPRVQPPLPYPLPEPVVPFCGSCL
jgi:hypothetical protein